MLIIPILTMLRAVIDVLERDTIVTFTEEPITFVVSWFIRTICAPIERPTMSNMFLTPAILFPSNRRYQSADAVV